VKNYKSNTKNIYKTNFNYLLEHIVNKGIEIEQIHSQDENNQNIENKRISTRNRRPSAFLKDYHHQIMSYVNINIPMNSTKFIHPISFILSYKILLNK